MLINMAQYQLEKITTKQPIQCNHLGSFILMIFLLLYNLNPVHAQDKIIGMNSSGGILGHRGNAFSMNTDGSNYQILDEETH